MLRSALLLCAATAALACTASGFAEQTATPAANQTQAIKRTPLQKFDVPGAGYETVIGIAEIAPNVAIGRHTHTGPEAGYLIEGGFELLVDGEQSRQLKAGDSYVVPPNTLHDAKTGAAGESHCDLCRREGQTTRVSSQVEALQNSNERARLTGE